MINCLEKQQQQLNHHTNGASLSQAFNQHQPAPTMYPPQRRQLNMVEAQAAGGNNNNNINNSNQQQSGNELIGYYFGSISRETAEWILKTQGNQLDGAYLLRSSGPNDDFVLSLMVALNSANSQSAVVAPGAASNKFEVLHYKIVETEDSFVALQGQVGDEKFATIDELIDKARGVATKPRWPISRQSLDSQILPPTYWGLTVDQVRLAILIKAKQWGFPLLSSLFQQQQQQQLDTTSQQQTNQQHLIGSTEAATIAAINGVTTLNNETIRTLIYKSLHEFQPWFHGKISREEAERRIEEGLSRDGRFLVRERDNYSYAMCISHKKTTKHYRIDVLPTGELAIQDGRKFTSLMALVSHYTIMSDGLWCALTEACIRPVATQTAIGRNSLTAATAPALINNTTSQFTIPTTINNNCNPYNSSSLINQNLYCVPPINSMVHFSSLPNESVNRTAEAFHHQQQQQPLGTTTQNASNQTSESNEKINSSLICAHQGGVHSIKAPIKEWLQNINHKWSQLIASKNQHQSLNSFLFGSQNPLNNHCRHNHHRHNHTSHRRKCRNGHSSCACIQQINANSQQMNFTNFNHNLPQQVAKVKDSTNTLSNTLKKNLFNPNACCDVNTCPATKDYRANGLNITNRDQLILSNLILNDEQNHNSNTLLSRLPQNSGFALSSQSFIGSPLFAVKTNTTQSDTLVHAATAAGSSNSGSGGSQKIEEEKLISPAQSISANLNNTNNLYYPNNDIYGSQTDTAIVTNDHLHCATSSSSSSGTMINKIKPKILNNPYGAAKTKEFKQLMMSAASVNGQAAVAVPPIMCGQHMGPAYRYTNCSGDENTLKPCYHRNLTTDDLHQTTTINQLAGQAAMAKFVQFQDGQCLRTHRDTRSIQMAYLSSRQMPNAQNSNQVPLRELNSQKQMLHCGNNNLHANTTANNVDGGGIAYLNNTSQLNSKSEIPLKYQPARSNQTVLDNHNQSFLMNNNVKLPLVENNANSTCQEIDLMDCGLEDDGGGFEFKYDPKLIKSSSIETLCGGFNDINDDLSNFKSNSDLLMSLQARWQNPYPRTHSPELLDPIQANDIYLFKQVAQEERLKQENDASQIVHSFNTTNDRGSERVDQMKKTHDLDELTTALLAELTASLKAQVDLKNKRSGFGLHSMEKQHHESGNNNQSLHNQVSQEVGANPLELINEFDNLKRNDDK